MEVLEGKRFAILSIMFWRFGAKRKLVIASRASGLLLSW
jgi:hypothetical protein